MLLRDALCWFDVVVAVGPSSAFLLLSCTRLVMSWSAHNAMPWWCRVCDAQLRTYALCTCVSHIRPNVQVALQAALEKRKLKAAMSYGVLIEQQHLIDAYCRLCVFMWVCVSACALCTTTG
jgi:hypothetical protein